MLFRTTQSADLPPELVAQWSRTQPLVAFAGCLGVAASLAMALGACALALLFFSAAPVFLIAGIVFFIAMVALASFRLLLRQSRAIGDAERENSISAAEDVLDRQTRYWKMVSAWTAVTLVLVVVLMTIGAEG
jgi:ABC-type branched-subunit amino acid transport system permease subunit